MPESALKRSHPVEVSKFIQTLNLAIPKIIEEAKANDPALLKSEIARLKTELARADKKQGEPKLVEIPVISQKDWDFFSEITDNTRQATDDIKRFTEVTARLVVGLNKLKDDLAARFLKVSGLKVGHTKPTLAWSEEIRGQQIKKTASELSLVGEATNSLTGGERQVMICIAQFGPCTREHISLQTDYKKSSRDAYISRLKARGFVESNGNSFSATTAGAASVVNEIGDMPTGLELVRWYQQRLSGGELQIFNIVAERHPEPASYEDIEAGTGFKKSSRDAYISRLRTRQIVIREGQSVRLSRNFFR